MIDCRTLGPVELTVDGAAAPAELLWKKNLALLLYLACSPQRARARDHVIGLLWPESRDAAARHSLNEALRIIRRCTGDAGVETQGDRIRLQPDAVRLDTERFSALAAVTDWRGAGDLVAGEFLEGFSVPGAVEFEHWLAAERAAWRGRCVEVLVRRADELGAQGHVAAATEAARRALALDPLSESGVRAAVRYLALAGNRAAALEEFDRFAARLGADVGTEPDADTAALAARVRRERAPRGLETAPVPEGAESRRPPLVGREAELARLAGAWGGCRRESRATAGLVGGDPGTGKTRLAEEFVARARLDGAVVAVTRAVEADAAEPWSGVLALARHGLLDAPGVAAAAAPALAELAARLPEWQERFATAARGTVPEQPGRALREVVRAVADEQPVVLAVDDAHWLDRDSLLALGAALRDLASARVFLLLTCSPQPPRAELDELQSRVGRDLAGVVVQLAPLSPEGLGALARWALPRYGDAELERLTRRVRADSAGLPLLAVELLHAVALGLDLEQTRAAWPEPLKTLDQTLPGDLPDAVVGAIRVGFRRLSAAAQTVLAAAAVLGERVPAAVVGRATGLDGEALNGALDELEWRRWLIAEPRGYAFVARIVREVVARDLVTAGQRQRILDATAHSSSRDSSRR